VSPLAASAGIGVLRDGGNAFDAAIATAAVEAVSIPAGCGLGGEPFVLMYQARTGKIVGLSGSGKAPLAADRDYFVSRGYSKMPERGPLSAAIPGEIHAYQDILDRFGTMPLGKLLEPAIGYAEEGHPVRPRMANGFSSNINVLNSYPQTAAIFTKNGAPLREGDLLVNRNLANTMRRIAKNGAEEFYKGDTGREIARSWAEAGGLYTFDEIASHSTEWYEMPISTTYRGYTIYETRPPSHGLMLLEMMNILEDFDVAGMGFYSPELVHAMVEAKKLAYADRNAYVGDLAFVDSPVDELISKEHAATRRAVLNMNRALTSVEAGPLMAPVPGDDNTSYFCVIDGEGNAVSFIHSLSMGFGSGFVAGNTGVVLNNRIGRGFSLVNGHPNVIEPGKRTMHTLNAYMVFKDDKPLRQAQGRLYMVGGTPGGDAQIQWNAQVITNIIDHGMNPQEALEAPRWVNNPGTDPATIENPFVLGMEPGMPGEGIESLRAKGHDVHELAEPTGGAVQLIMIDHDRGIHMAGSDPRTDGHAAAI
jgi:gamma-glutamyltranspeptidase/glutathione hydrolase